MPEARHRRPQDSPAMPEFGTPRRRAQETAEKSIEHVPRSIAD
jgi:hypothetical protein